VAGLCGAEHGGCAAGPGQELRKQALSAGATHEQVEHALDHIDETGPGQARRALHTLIRGVGRDSQVSADWRPPPKVRSSFARRAACAAPRTVRGRGR
jgi:hypothetical protein